MKSDFTFISFIFFIVIIFVLPERSFSQVLVEEDDRVIVFVESLSRADSYPETLTISGLLYSIPAKGSDLVLIYLNIVEKQDLGINKLEKKFPVMRLVDSRRNRYKARIHGIIDPDSPARKREYVYFHMPKDETPVRMEIKYPYREAELPQNRTVLHKKAKIRTGELTIDLTSLLQANSQ